MSRSSRRLSTAIATFLPRLQPWTVLHLGDGEVLIHAPGFEERTLAATDVSVSGAPRAILLDYRPKNSSNQLGRVRAALSEHNVRIQDSDVLTYHRFEPDGFEGRLRSRLSEIGVRRVTVDISTMSKLAIILVLAVCAELQLDLRIIYAEADHYGPTEEEFLAARDRNEIHQPTLQVFTGVHGVVRTTSLASVAMQGQPTAALVFMSFNDVLTQVLLNAVYPSRLFLINGRPPVAVWREQATAWIHEQVRHEWDRDNPVEDRSGSMPLPSRVVSTLDYTETVSLLLELYWELSSNHRILLAPAGSKMQAVGCFIAKALHPDIHIEYPSPEGFASEYSSGISKRWQIDLGPIQQLLALIASAERQEYLEIGT
jgi:hypothetical protein